MKQGLSLLAQTIEAGQIFSDQLLSLRYAQIEKVNLCAAVKKLEMQMRTGGVAGLTDIANDIARIDALTRGADFAQNGRNERSERYNFRNGEYPRRCRNRCAIR